MKTGSKAFRSFFNPVRLEWLVDLPVCIMLSGALALVLFGFAGFEGGLWRCLTLALADTLLLVLLTRRRWIFPVLLGIFAAVVLLYCYITKSFVDMYEYWRGFFEWCALLFPQTLPYSVNGSMLIVETAIVIPMAGASLLFVRRFFSTGAMAIIMGAGVLAISKQNHPFTHEFQVLLLLCCGISIPRLTAKKSGKNGASGGDAISRASMQLLAIPAAAIAVALALLAVPADMSSWQSRFLVMRLRDLGDYTNFYFGEVPSYDGYVMSRDIFSDEGGRLGGSISPANKRVLSVAADFPVYLRDNIQDTYTGYNWRDGWQNGVCRFDSLLWRSQRFTAFDGDKPLGGASARNLYAELVKPVNIHLYYETSGLFTIFSAGQVVDINMPLEGSPDTYFDVQGETFTMSPVRLYEQIDLQTVVFDRFAPNFDDNMRELEKIVTDGNIRDESYQRARERGLALPESLPQSVSDLAAEITAELVSPYDKALALESWLASNCVYTQTVAEPPQDKDFVEHFLETRQGYCVYFASAMSVMARCVDLPSRYVSGYGLSALPDGNYEVTEATAHAWTEIYFEGIGWVAFNPSGGAYPWLNENPQADRDESAVFYEEEEEPFYDDGMFFDFELDLEQKTNVNPVMIAVSISFVVVFLVVFGRVWAFPYLMNTYHRRFEIKRVCSKYISSSSQAEYYYTGILSQLAYFDVIVQPGNTIATLMERAGRYVGADKAAVIRVGRIMMDLRFGLIEPSLAQIEAMADCHRQLEELLQSRMGRARYFWRRIILGSF